MKRTELSTLVEKAQQQGGLLGPQDVAPATRRELLRSPVWREVLTGVLGPAVMGDSVELLEAAAMLWEPRSVLSHSTAARHLGIWVPDDDRVWLSVPWESRRRDVSGLELVRSRAFRQTFVREGLLRLSPPTRTVVDLSMTLTPKQLEASLLSAVRKDLTTAEQVATAAAALRTRPGITTLLELTGLWTPARESLLEDGLHADVVLAAPGERVERQWVVTCASGRTARLDVAIPRLKLAFEADGLYFHSTDAQIAADQGRDRDLMVEGWQTARFREGPIADHPGVRRQVRALVEARARELGA